MIGPNRFHIIAHHVLIGNQVIVRCSCKLLVRTILDCLKVLYDCFVECFYDWCNIYTVLCTLLHHFLCFFLQFVAGSDDGTNFAFYNNILLMIMWSHGQVTLRWKHSQN